MRRSAYALVAGTAVTSLLGLLFWALAARWLPAATVGIGAALVSLLTLLANISTLGLRNGLVRFLPEAGPATRRLVARSYALCAAAAIAVAAVFLLGQPWWADELGFLRSSPLAAVAFVAATAVWVLFILQDHVLTGLHKTIWVPITNAICSLAKIALLPIAGVQRRVGDLRGVGAASRRDGRRRDGADPASSSAVRRRRRPADHPDGPACPVRRHRPRRRAGLVGHRRHLDPDGAPESSGRRPAPSTSWRTPSPTGCSW